MFGIGIAMFAISGGFAIAFYALWLDSRKRQMRHAERMAMIEKGLAPSSIVDAPAETGAWDAGRRRSQRSSAVWMICLGTGLALMFLLVNDGSWRQTWIGGFLILFGIANLVNSIMDERDRERSLPAPRPSNEPR